MPQTERGLESNKERHIPTKKFYEGDIVYWVENNHQQKPYVNFGIVEDSYNGMTYYLAMLEPNIKRFVRRLDTETNKFVDVCEINDFQTDQHYYKLPKKWSYDTKLFEIVTEEKDLGKINPKNPQEIKEALDKGILRKKNHFVPNIEEEISKGMFRLIRKSTADYLFARSKDSCYIFETYEECQKICDEIEAENKRIANLSDYDFNLEELNNKLDFIFKDDEITKNSYRDYLLSKDKFEDIEFRCYGMDLQWRYWENKKWLNVDLGY